MHAARNITLCNKDCVCLFVCPTGATDTETGQIDFQHCLDGCRLCVDACPSHALYLVMDNYAEPIPKKTHIAEALLSLLDTKYAQEQMAEFLATHSDNEAVKRLASALQHSCRILAEDCAREAGYMLPQSREVRKLLVRLREISDSEIKELADQVL